MGGKISHGQLQPPLTRGILLMRIGMSATRPSTPARAGNTIARRHQRCPPAFNPRSRGEYRWNSPHGWNASLQPPLARGIRCCQSLAHEVFPSTPARAGNTNPVFSSKSILSFNPRSRGEYLMAAIRSASACLQPPLARGIHRRISPDLA